MRRGCVLAALGLRHAQPASDEKSNVGLALALQGHGKKCNKRYEECFVCQRNTLAYASIPAPTMNKVLSEPQVHNGRLSIAELTVGAMMRRTTEQVRNGRQGPRAKFALVELNDVRDVDIDNGGWIRVTNSH